MREAQITNAFLLELVVLLPGETLWPFMDGTEDTKAVDWSLAADAKSRF